MKYLENPLVSVLLPVYNAQETLKESIDSILAQSYTFFELIIIDDGSIDSSNKIILSYSDSRIRYYRNEDNKGLIYTLNKCISYAQGVYLARMDADDIMYPERLELQVAYLNENLDVVVLGTQIDFFGSKKAKLLKRQLPTNPADLAAYLFLATPINHPTAMIRSNVVKEQGIKYNENYRHVEDYKLWADISKYGNFANLENKLLKYRLSDSQISSQHSEEQLEGAQKIRKDLILDFLLSHSLPVFINLNNIRPLCLRLCKIQANKSIVDNIILILLMSSSHPWKDCFFYYLFSFDFLRYSLPIKYSLILLSEFVRHRKKYYALK